ncbi:MAG: VanZ family protein [Actinomycetota bacterium]
MGRRRFVIGAVAVAFTIFIGSVIWAANTGFRHPGGTLVRALPYGDKFGHVILFGLLALLLNLATGCRSVRLWPTSGRLLLGSLGVLAFAAVEELSQGFVATRSLDLTDFLADLVGIALATIAAPPLYRLLLDGADGEGDGDGVDGEGDGDGTTAAAAPPPTGVPDSDP